MHSPTTPATSAPLLSYQAPGRQPAVRRSALALAAMLFLAMSYATMTCSPRWLPGFRFEYACYALSSASLALAAVSIGRAARRRQVLVIAVALATFTVNLIVLSEIPSRVYEARPYRALPPNM